MTKSKIIIYTDGSSRSNPGPGGWGVIVAGDDQVVELGGRETLTTNNRMELMAAIKGISFLVSQLQTTNYKLQTRLIEMRVDSQYVINGITQWIMGWKRHGWVNSKKEPVLNRDLWEILDEVVSNVHKKNGARILWRYTPGHVGIPGNDRADAIATGYADGQPPKLFDDVLGKYTIDLDQIEPSLISVKQKKSPAEKARQKIKAYSYLSLV
ncbi:ribonuclease HI [Candidatus Azambacteria bacterium]|nr:ribonuclease HI [Candidatus Azambacteria bacterium]